RASCGGSASARSRGGRRARPSGAAERELRPARRPQRRRRAIRAWPQRRRVPLPLRARGRSRALVPRGRRLRARGRPLARLRAATALTHRRRERRPLARPCVRHLLGRRRRARGLDDRGRRDNAARARLKTKGLLDLVVVDEVAGRILSLRPFHEGHGDALDPVSLDLEHVEAHAVVGDVVAALGSPPELPEDEAADAVEVLIRELGAEALVELVDREPAVYTERILPDLLHRLVRHVELVLDLADDLLEE